jgi:hypothetical protein
MLGGQGRVRVKPAYPPLQLALNASGYDDCWQQQREEQARNSGKP